MGLMLFKYCGTHTGRMEPIGAAKEVGNLDAGVQNEEGISGWGGEAKKKRPNRGESQNRAKSLDRARERLRGENRVGEWPEASSFHSQGKKRVLNESSTSRSRKASFGRLWAARSIRPQRSKNKKNKTKRERERID